MSELNKLTKEYLDRNGITHTFFAKWIGCKEASRLSRWLNYGTQRLTDEEMKQVHAFLSGKHMVSLDEILGGEVKDEDSTV